MPILLVAYDVNASDKSPEAAKAAHDRRYALHQFLAERGVELSETAYAIVSGEKPSALLDFFKNKGWIIASDNCQIATLSLPGAGTSSEQRGQAAGAWLKAHL